MNFDNLLDRDLPTGALALIGIVLLFIVLRTGKVLMRLLLLPIAAGLLATAYWWYFKR